jgi:multiple sugar transport system permease protein
MKQKHSGYAKWGYIFCLPFTIAFLIFSLYPIIFTAIIGFTDFKGLGTIKFNFLKDDLFLNFKNILANASFRQSFKNTLIMWISNFIPQIGLALLLTAWFTDNRFRIKGKGLFKILFYMPNIITAATIAILFYSLIGYPKGPINDLLMMLGFTDKAINMPVNKAVARGSVAFIQFWMWYGYTMIILISGVLGISPEIFESAEVDGASRVQTFFYITLPNLKTILLFTFVTSLIGGLQMFDIPKLFLLGGPDNSTLTTSLFIFNQAFSGSYLYNRASAASMIMFIIICAAAATLFFAMRDKEEIALEKLVKQQEKEYRKMEKERRKSHE